MLHAPNPGLRFDRAFRMAVPEQVVAKLDISLEALVDSRELEIDPAARAAGSRPRRNDPESVLSIQSGISLHDLAIDLTHDRARSKRLIRLANPDPIRFLQGELREPLARRARPPDGGPGQKKGHRHVPVGPYRLTVIPSVRGRSAGQVAIQGMPNKQIEILTPPFRSADSDSKPIMAAWVYQDSSLVMVHLDFRGIERYILWHAPYGRQSNYDYRRRAQPRPLPARPRSPRPARPRPLQ